MNFAITPEQRELRESIIKFAKARLNPGIIERDREQTFSRELWMECARMGLTGLPIPEEYGGAGLDPVTMALALEAFGYGCEDRGLAFSICAHLLPCTVPIWKYGNEEQKRRWLPGLCDGSVIAVNGMTEPGSGSDAFGMRTTAVKDGTGWRINGTKMFSSNGPIADLAVVFAFTDTAKGFNGGVSAFLVPRDAPGFRPGQKFEKMGLRTSPIGELVLDDVRVGDDALLGGVGGGSTLFTHSMDWERTFLFALHVGAMEALLEKAITYARTRTQFGQPIAKFQAVSHKIADMKVRLEAARLLVYRTAWKVGEGKNVSMDASISKLFASESLLKTALDVVQVLGGYGFMTEYEVERALRDAVGGTIYSGTSEMQRNIISRWLGL